MQSSHHTTPCNTITPRNRFFSMAQVCEMAGISRSTLIRAEKSGSAPPGRRFGARCVRFDRIQIEQWLSTGKWSPLPWQQEEVSNA